MPSEIRAMLLVILGGLLATPGSAVVESIKWKRATKITRKKNKVTLEAIMEEIETGLERCKTIVNDVQVLKDKDGNVRTNPDGTSIFTISPTRVYTTLWDSINSNFINTIEQNDTVKLLHKIYYRFSLVNFQADRQDWVKAYAFAKKYSCEIDQNRSKLKKIVEGKKPV